MKGMNKLSSFLSVLWKQCTILPLHWIRAWSPPGGFATAFLPSNLLCPSESDVRGVTGLSTEHVTDVMPSSYYLQKQSPWSFFLQSNNFEPRPGWSSVAVKFYFIQHPWYGISCLSPLLLSVINIFNLYICCLLKTFSFE